MKWVILLCGCDIYIGSQLNNNFYILDVE